MDAARLVMLGIGHTHSLIWELYQATSRLPPERLVLLITGTLTNTDPYAVEVTSPGGRHLVLVSLGLFDDAAGLVQVSGSGLIAGQDVVVPTI